MNLLVDLQVEGLDLQVEEVDLQVAELDLLVHMQVEELLAHDMFLGLNQSSPDVVVALVLELELDALELLLLLLWICCCCCCKTGFVLQLLVVMPHVSISLPEPLLRSL